jgi:hypothetical protein
MKKILKNIGILTALIAILIVGVIIITPWMDRWGATDAEINATFAGDELVPDPASFVNHAVTINATPEKIYPWLLQLGAGKGGFYSYTALENAIGCQLVNADRIHNEWQDLKVGDKVEMCPNGTPPGYIVAQILPNEALVMGHQENGKWVDLWQYILVPQADHSTRLILRTRTMMTGTFWDVIHPGIFIMERGLLLGIKERVEKMP